MSTPNSPTQLFSASASATAGAAARGPLQGDRPEMVVPSADEGTDELVSIIVVHKDRPEYLNILLQSITVASLNNNYELIVVDNGSGQDSQDYLDSIEGEVRVVRMPQNVWWSRAANAGVKAADPNSKYYIFLHHDVVVLNPGWIDLLVSVADQQESGLVGVDMSKYEIAKQDVQFITEWCVLLSAECYRECGPWSEELPQLGAPFMMTYAAQQRGFRPQVVRNNIVHHYGVFALDYSDFEQFSIKAQAAIPTLMRQVQGRPQGRA